MKYVQEKIVKKNQQRIKQKRLVHQVKKTDSKRSQINVSEMPIKNTSLENNFENEEWLSYFAF